MLFTDFLQTHQSNLHPSDRFPLLNFTKIFRGDANPSNNHRVKAGLWDLREWYIIRNHSEHSTVNTRQKTCEWAFEWKVIQHSTCHGSQRQTISSSQLLQPKSCQSLLVFCPVVTSVFKSEGPPHSESEKQRGDLGCEAGEKEAHFRRLTFTQLRHHTLPTDRTSAGHFQAYFKCTFRLSIILRELQQTPKQTMNYNYCLSNVKWKPWLRRHWSEVHPWTREATLSLFHWD